MTEYGVLMFHTTSSVMKAEKVLVKKGFIGPAYTDTTAVLQ